MTPEEAFATAIKILGSKARLAAAIGTTRQHLNFWDVVPKKWVQPVLAAIAEARAIKAPTAHDLRPDLFPKPRAAGRGAASITKTAKKPRKGD